MATNDPPSVPPGKAFTAPKGRPTRPRDAVYARKRVFGPVWQWIAVVLALLIAFAIVVAVTDGGDFNPFNDDDAGATGGIVASGQPIGR